MQNETIFLKDLNYITYSTGILQVIFEYSNLIVRCVCNLFILIFCQKDSQLFVLIHDLMKKAFSFWLILLCNLSDAFLYNQAKLCIVFFCSLPISLITFSPIHHSGVAPAHWLKPFCSQVIFLLASSQTVQLTLLFDSI